MADALRAHSAPPLQTHTRVEELGAGRHIESATRDTPLASLRGTHALVGDRSAALNRPKLRRLFHARLGGRLEGICWRWAVSTCHNTDDT